MFVPESGFERGTSNRGYSLDEFIMRTGYTADCFLTPGQAVEVRGWLILYSWQIVTAQIYQIETLGLMDLPYRLLRLGRRISFFFDAFYAWSIDANAIDNGMDNKISRAVSP